MNRSRSGAVGWWSEHPLVDFILVSVLVVIHLAAITRWSSADVLEGTSISQRLTLYAAGATVAAILGGVTSVAVALYQSLGGDRGGAVRRHYGSQLRRNWRALLTTTGLVPLLCIIAMAYDRPGEMVVFPRFVFEAALLLALTRFLRLIWLFDAFLHVDDVSRTDRPKPPPPAFNESWGPRPNTPAPVPAAHR